MANSLTLTAAALVAMLDGWTGLWQGLVDSSDATLGAAQIAVPAPMPPPIAIDVGDGTYTNGGGGPRVALSAVSVSGKHGGKAWQWAVGDVYLTPPDRQDNIVRVLLPSPQTFRLAQGKTGRVVTLWATNLAAVVHRDTAGRVSQTRLTGDGITLQSGDHEFSAESLIIKSERTAPDRVRIGVAITDIVLPAAWHLGPPFGDTMESIKIDAWVHGLGDPRPTSAVAWRDGGGVVGLNHVRAKWGPLAVNISGRFGLDGVLRPEGRVRVAITGVDEALVAATEAGVISESTRNAASDGLARLARLRQTDAVTDLSLSFELGGGRLSFEGLPLVGLPAIAKMPKPAAPGCETKDAPNC